MSENKNLTRIPQAFTFDTNAITRTYGEQAALIRDVLVFLANKTTTSFFEDFTFTLDEFCQEFGYRKDEMQKTLPEFINCPENQKPIEEGHCFDSVFEYALYAGFTKVIVFSVKNFNGQGFDLQNIVLFRRIRAVYKKSKRNERRHYLIELDYRIKQMQLNRFFLTDKEQYKDIVIPKKQKLTGGLRNFYLYIGRMIAIVKYNIKLGQDPFYILTIDDIAKIMDLSISNNAKRKFKVKEYLDKLNSVLADYGFEYSFFKGNGQRYEYSVRFSFPKETLDYFDEKNKARFFNKISEGITLGYFENVINKDRVHNYMNWKRSITQEEGEDAFRWLLDKDHENYYSAKKYFTDKFKEIYGIEYDNRFGEI